MKVIDGDHEEQRSQAHRVCDGHRTQQLQGRTSSGTMSSSCFQFDKGDCVEKNADNADADEAVRNDVDEFEARVHFLRGPIPPYETEVVHDDVKAEWTARYLSAVGCFDRLKTPDE